MEPLGSDVQRELRALGPNAAMSETAEAWPAAVGLEIARNAWPARYQRDGTLIVYTKDAIWAFELGHRAAEIAARLPGKPPLKFLPGPLPEPPAVEAVPAPPAATLEQRRQAEEWAAAIEDEELRERVARAAAASLARARDDRRF